MSNVWAPTRHFFAAIPLLLVFGACGGNGADGEPSTRRSTEPPQLHAEGIFRQCGGGTRSSANPFGLNGAQWQSPQANGDFLNETWTRAEAIEAATSKPVRIVFHQPGGWFDVSGDGGMHGAIPTVPIMNGRTQSGRELYSWRWDVWADELTRTSSVHPDWILSVYFSGQVPTAAAQDAVDARQGFETYDHDDPRHHDLLMGVVDQWLAVGVREFIFDGSSRVEDHPELALLAADIRARGGRVFVEPHARNEDRTLRTSLYQHIDGSLSTHANMITNEPESLDWVIPEGAIMMIALTGHESSKAPSRTPARSSDVLDYRRRGFVMLSGSPNYDHFITGAEPPSEPNSPAGLLDGLFP